MNPTLENSQTKVNLMRAFAGECQARTRYDLAACTAKAQNLHVLQALFQFTANQEREHAEVYYNHLKPLSGKTIQIDGGYPIDLDNAVDKLLRMAEHNEVEEWEIAYPSFGDIAKQEGFAEIAQSFYQIAKIEKIHAFRFGAFAQLLEQGKLFTDTSASGWICLNCGHVHEGNQAPKQCPVCSHNQGFFIRLQQSPFCDCTGCDC